MALSPKCNSLLNKALGSKGYGLELRTALDATTTGVARLRTGVSRLTTGVSALKRRHAAALTGLNVEATTVLLRVKLNSVMARLRTGLLMTP